MKAHKKKERAYEAKNKPLEDRLMQSEVECSKVCEEKCKKLEVYRLLLNDINEFGACVFKDIEKRVLLKVVKVCNQ